jgi:hypothetical protein
VTARREEVAGAGGMMERVVKRMEERWMRIAAECPPLLTGGSNRIIAAALIILLLMFRIHRIHVFFGLPDPDPLARGMDLDPALDPDPSVIMQK